MKGIEILVEEHDNILRALHLVQVNCLNILDDKKVDVDFFKDVIDFIRNYADKIHHGKEEELLFKEMVANLGDLGYKLINNGMLVEHDLARYNVLKLEESLNAFLEDNSSLNMLDIVTYAMGYRDLLLRHIEKENKVVYTFAEKNLSSDILNSVTESTLKFEEDHKEEIEKYLNVLDFYENKYL